MLYASPYSSLSSSKCKGNSPVKDETSCTIFPPKFIHKLTDFRRIDIQWRRKGMVRESKVLHKNPETSYVEEGFSVI